MGFLRIVPDRVHRRGGRRCAKEPDVLGARAALRRFSSCRGARGRRRTRAGRRRCLPPRAPLARHGRSRRGFGHGLRIDPLRASSGIRCPTPLAQTGGPRPWPADAGGSPAGPASPLQRGNYAGVSHDAPVALSVLLALCASRTDLDVHVLSAQNQHAAQEEQHNSHAGALYGTNVDRS